MSNNYFIETNNKEVKSWSVARIPYEPKGWLLQYRNHLQNDLDNLVATDEDILSATYSSPVREYVDVENLLFYNIGPAHMAHITRKGLLFSRQYNIKNPCPQPLISHPSHHYLYRLMNARDFKESANKDESLLATIFFNTPAQHINECASIWYSIKQGVILLNKRSFVGAEYLMNIHLICPLSIQFAFSKIVKPLIDGITSALHYHDGSNIEYLSRFLSENLGSDPREIGQFLVDRQNALFGRVNLLFPYRNKIKWNPKDEYCTWSLITCDYVTRASQEIEIKVTIHERKNWAV
jgi:hypothetical protein